MDSAQQVESTGVALRAEREASGVSMGRVARAWPCSTANIYLIETAAHVTESRRAHYLAALARAKAPATLEGLAVSYVGIGERLQRLAAAEADA